MWARRAVRSPEGRERPPGLAENQVQCASESCRVLAPAQAQFLPFALWSQLTVFVKWNESVTRSPMSCVLNGRGLSSLVFAGECTDTTHYCTSVKHLNLCSLDLYKQRCCQSCREG